jgi:hypothetical protein
MKIKIKKNKIINNISDMLNIFSKININETNIDITGNNIENNTNKKYKINNIDKIDNINNIILNDKYDDIRLKKRFYAFKNNYIEDEELIKDGLPIRHQNMPEDISENIAKFIIRKFENDNTCVWCKGVDKSYGLTGDLYSNKYDKKYTIEIKSFTSNGPSQFGPNKKFGVLYFLDLRNFLNNEIILWKANLTCNSFEYKNIKINKNQTLEEQMNQGRRPHINWNRIYPQIKSDCEKIYKGTFEDIF